MNIIGKFLARLIGCYGFGAKAGWPRLLPFTGLLAVAVLSASACATSAGSLSWQDRFDLGYIRAFAGPVAIAGHTVYVAGAGAFADSPGSNADIHVRAYNLRTGDLRWENVWDASSSAGERGHDDVPVGLVRAGNILIVAAHTGLNTLGSERSVSMRALDRRDGTVLWEKRCAGSSPGGDAPYGPDDALIASSGLVFLAGNCYPATTGIGGMLGAYTASDGTLVWQKVNTGIQLGIAQADGQIFDAGLDSTGALVLRSYDESTGTLRWVAHPSPPAGYGLSFLRLAAGDGNVFVMLESSGSGGALSHRLLGYNDSTGSLVWQSDASDVVRAITEKGGQVLVAEDGNSALVQAFDSGTGAVLWQDQPASPSVGYSGQAIAAGAGLVYVGGSSYTPSAEDASNLFLRVYDMNGHLVWQDNQPTTAKMNAQANDIAWKGNEVIITGDAGKAIAPFGLYDWVVRADRLHGGSP